MTTIHMATDVIRVLKIKSTYLSKWIRFTVISNYSYLNNIQKY